MAEENGNQVQQVLEAVEGLQAEEGIQDEEGLQAEEIEENGGEEVDIEDDPVMDIECMRFFQPDEEDDDEEEEGKVEEENDDEEEEEEEEGDDEEEEEDVDSDGECDEEVQKVVDDLLMKERALLEKITLDGAEGVKAVEQPATEQPATVQPVAMPPNQQQQPTSSSSQPRSSTPVHVEIVNVFVKHQLWMKCPRRPNHLPPNVRVVDVQDPTAEKGILSIAEGIIDVLGLSPGKDFVTAFNENFVLGICYSESPCERFFCRFNPRNFLFDPPVYEECIDNERFVSEETKKAYVARKQVLYPHMPNLTYVQLSYLEDAYWFQQRPIPEGVRVPPQSVDFEERKKRIPKSVRTLYKLVTGTDQNLDDFMRDCVHAMALQDRQKRGPIGIDLSHLPF